MSAGKLSKIENGKVRGTWDEPKEAANWLGQQLAEYAPRFASEHDRDTMRMAVRVASAAERLALGGDVSPGSYLRGASFLSVALVTCSPNRAEPELPCPLGQDEQERKCSQYVPSHPRFSVRPSSGHVVHHTHECWSLASSRRNYLPDG